MLNSSLNFQKSWFAKLKTIVLSPFLAEPCKILTDSAALLLEVRVVSPPCPGQTTGTECAWHSQQVISRDTSEKGLGSKSKLRPSHTEEMCFGLCFFFSPILFFPSENACQRVNNDSCRGIWSIYPVNICLQIRIQRETAFCHPNDLSGHWYNQTFSYLNQFPWVNKWSLINLLKTTARFSTHHRATEQFTAFSSIIGKPIACLNAVLDKLLPLTSKYFSGCSVAWKCSSPTSTVMRICSLGDLLGH